jgi:hypothetical protein
VVEILDQKVRGNVLELHLAGPIEPTYVEELEAIASRKGVREQLFIYGRIPYSKLPDLTSSCHVGLTIYGSHNITVRTISTAGNKTFEYASVGLPVLYEKRPDLQEEFASFRWISFSELDPQSLVETLARIFDRYAEFSNVAKNDFSERINFEHGMVPFLNQIKNEVGKRISAN